MDVGEPLFAEFLGLPPIDIALFRAEAQQTARAMVGALIQRIEVPQLLVIQDLIAQGFAAAHTPTAMARAIAAVVGLDDRRAKALARFEAEVRAAGEKSEAKILRLVDADRRRKLKSRGIGIARTESTRTASKAQDMIWRQAIEQGQMAEGEYEQEWVPSPLACPICEGLRGARAPIGGRFPEPGGEGPPGPHPLCRCHRRLRRPE